MKKALLIVVCLATAILNAAASSPAESPEQTIIRRFLVSVGANSGGEERAQLRYAVNDAEAILQVFKELGGVDSEDQQRPGKSHVHSRVSIREIGPAASRFFACACILGKAAATDDPEDIITRPELGDVSADRIQPAPQY